MTEPPTPAEVMLAATKNTLRTGRMAPARVVTEQLEALTNAGYRLVPTPSDGGAELLLATAKRAFWAGHFRPAEVIALQLEELGAAGHYFESVLGREGGPCDDFVWGPNSFESCEECGLSFWRHGESDTRESPTRHSSEI